MDEATRQGHKLLLEPSLLKFTQYMFLSQWGRRFIVSDHHLKIIEALEQVVNGTLPNGARNLLINIPPRYGKTEVAVINFVAWCMARNPQALFIHLSYSDKLVMDNSSRVRELMKHEAYKSVWPIDWKQDADAKGLWKTQQGGAFMASPAGGTITGFGAGSTELGCYGKKFAGAIIIDDPLKPDDARSEVERTAVNERLINTIMSRRNSRETPIILIMQRLHEDDMTGFVLSGKTGEAWHHLKMPALDGDKPLWEHKHSIADLLAIKAANPYMFSGQYQQEPAPEEGIYFLRDWFKPYTHLPANLNYYGASDFAVSDKRGDYTVHGVFGIDPQGEIYLVDWWRKQSTADVWVEQMLDMAERYKTLAWAMEGGVIEKAVMPLIRSRMMARHEYPRLAVYPSTTDKEARARNIQGRMAARGVHVPSQPWVADLLTECINFPNGKHDDQVDVLSLFGNMLANLKPGVIPPKEKETINTELPTIEQMFKMRQRELDTI